MRAHGWVVAVLGLLAATAAAEPKPSAVDIKPFRDKLLVLADANKGHYVVKLDGDEQLLFYGTGKALYRQIIIGSSRNGDAWDFSTWAPRLAGVRLASFGRKADGGYFKSCDGKDDAVLTELSGDKAKAVIDKSEFLTEALVHRAHMLARDDSGVYYYVDRLAQIHGGKGYRVFVGKKGALKQLPLTDVASDTAGEVFSTRTGDLRLTRTTDGGGGSKAIWVRGEKRTELISLDTDANSQVIFRDLGIYKFTGTLCENI